MVVVRAIGPLQGPYVVVLVLELPTSWYPGRILTLTTAQEWLAHTAPATAKLDCWLLLPSVVASWWLGSKSKIL